MRKAIILITASLLLAIAGGNANAQKSYKRVVKDSISLGNYEAVFYNVLDRSGERQLSEELTIYRDGKPASTTFSSELSLFNFASGNEKAKPAYRKDINKDGIDEIIIRAHSGEDICCNIMTVHGLGEDLISDVSRFELKEGKTFYLKDIDNDTIPEIFFKDAQFVGWHAPVTASPMPLLVWQWRNGNYRLANFKFGDYLMKQISQDEVKSLREKISKWAGEYDANNESTKYPPPELWGLALDYIYAGHSDKADSLIEEYWPKEISGKKEFTDEFQAHLKDSPFWQGLQGSDF